MGDVEAPASSAANTAKATTTKFGVVYPPKREMIGPLKMIVGASSFAPMIIVALVHGTAFVRSLSALIASVLIFALRVYLKRQNYIRLHPKPFDIVNVSMFTALSILSYFAAPFMEHWLHLAMNLIIFTYFFMSTFIFHQPFTLQFAKEEAPPVLWEEESFVKMNYQLSGMYTIALGLITVSTLLQQGGRLWEEKDPANHHLPKWWQPIFGKLLTTVPIIAAIILQRKIVGNYRAGRAQLIKEQEAAQAAAVAGGGGVDDGGVRLSSSPTPTSALLSGGVGKEEVTGGEERKMMS